MKLARPQLLLLIATIAAWMAALAGAGLLRADIAAAAAIQELPLSARVLFGDLHKTEMAKAKRRCERKLIDFVELM